MTDPTVDTDVLLRLLTGDDPSKQDAAAALFRRVDSGDLVLTGPDTVIADAVHVLSSRALYNFPRQHTQELLAGLLRRPGFQIDNRRSLIRALAIFASSNLDFGDAMIVASMRQAESTVLYSYDHDFDRFPDIQRLEP